MFGTTRFISSSKGASKWDIDEIFNTFFLYNKSILSQVMTNTPDFPALISAYESNRGQSLNEMIKSCAIAYFQTSAYKKSALVCEKLYPNRLNDENFIAFMVPLCAVQAF